MFRKIVSNLSFSPSLVTELGFYAHRLKGEEMTRRLTIIFVVLTLVIESLAVFSPPESANASSQTDLIPGGVTSLNDFLTRYDQDTGDIKDIYTTLGITRDEIAAAKKGTFNSKDSIYSITRVRQYSPEQGETSFTYLSSTGSIDTRYISPLDLADTTPTEKQTGTVYSGWVGQSAHLGWFAIIQANASLATKGYPATVTPDSSGATLPVTRTISALNTSQGANAATVTARSFDKISYTVNLKNTGSSTIQLPISVNLGDALEYATLADSGGGTFDNTNQTLSWGIATVAPGATQQRSYALQLLSPIPATPTGTSNPNSYDCIMSTSFGTTTKIPVDCPPEKVLQAMLSSLPPISSIVSFSFVTIILTVSVYFYLRTRQLKHEMRLIRHQLNTGAL